MANKKINFDKTYEYVPIEIITKSMDHDEQALTYILRRYQAYIEKLSSYRVRDRNGRYFTIIDEDKKQQIEAALILAIRQFRIKE